MTTTSGTMDYRDPGPFGSDYAIRFHPGAETWQAFFDNTRDNMSVELWVQVVATPSTINAALFGNAQSSGGSGIAGWTFDVTTTRHAQLIVQGVAVQTQSVATIPAPVGAPNNKLWPFFGFGGGGGVTAWVMLNGVRDAGRWKYYFNGVLDSSAGTNTPNSMTAGGLCSFGPGGSGMDARYAYVSYWTKALSATDVSNHYAAAGA